MKGLLEFKQNSGGVKDVDMKSRVVTGYLASIETKDFSEDIFTKGFATKTLNERRNEVLFLNQHRFDQPHGKFSILQEDTKGLYFESEPLINTSYSEDALKLYDAGIMKEHSIGFITTKHERKGAGRLIKEIKLYEGSNVTLGDNPNTPFMGFKGLSITETNDKIGMILKFFKTGTVTDDTFILLELALKDLQKHAYEIGLNTKKKEVITEPTAAEMITAYLNKN